MRLVLLAHPRPGSLNHALAARAADALARDGAEVVVHDLYEERFDPVLRADEAFTSGQRAEDVASVTGDELVRTHRDQLASADTLVVVHPNWWGKPPAILAGWLDRVLIPGVAYRLDDAGGAPESLLCLQRLLVVNTSDTPAEREADYGDPLEAIWTRCVAPYVGAPRIRRLVFRVVADADPQTRAGWLDEVDAACRSLLA
jgi:putative NADPH-quinone reductase